MGANNIFSVLYAMGFNSSCCCYNWAVYTISLSRCECIIFSLFGKLISEPISVLLEVERSKTSGERHHQRIPALLTKQVLHFIKRKPK